MEKRKFYIETYGCQMNLSDTEIIHAILAGEQMIRVEDPAGADVILLNTCSVRGHAEERVMKRLREMRSLKKKKPSLLIGVVGCMAEQVKETLFEKEPVIDLIAGPDAYRELPQLLVSAGQGQKGINLLLSAEETYADIHPVREEANGVSAFLSVMRGCENFCSYCVVPHTRGKERSRDPSSILRESRDLFSRGFREITLLGQNVNSYNTVVDGKPWSFAKLIGEVAEISPLLRIRFATSHPKDLSLELMHAISAYPNICKSIHLPVQSGSNVVLQRMNRNYTREHYLEKVETLRRVIPGCGISTDILSGFCGETEEDHQATLDLMEQVQFDAAFMFIYSERPGTDAAITLKDGVPQPVKERRLKEIIHLQQRHALSSNKKDIGKVLEVLVEGVSKRSADHLFGCDTRNKVVIFPREDKLPGDYVRVSITECSSATLKGRINPVSKLDNPWKVGNI